MSDSLQVHPAIREGESIISAADNRDMMRRLDDQSLPSAPLDWGNDGTPLPPSSIVYLYRPHAGGFALWSEIRTQERLAEVQASPGHFELRVLFTVPVEDLARGALVPIMEARLRLDRIKKATDQAISGMHDVIRELAVKP
jgi:hypothetical protein